VCPRKRGSAASSALESWPDLRTPFPDSRACFPMKNPILLPVLLALALVTAAPLATASPTLPPLPLQQDGGTWPSGHVQGIAVDRQRGYIYYSFTDLLAKYDFHGNLIGTLVGWTGHLGDLDFNAADGHIYGSLE